MVSSNGNSTAQKFGYNGVELEESLGLNLHEMDFRLYDPAIGRFNGIDPVVHFSQGTSVAFDNNPIYWADPSGANSTAEWMEENGITQDDLITIYQAPDNEESNNSSKEDCPKCDNQNILLDFIQSVGFLNGAKRAEKAIKDKNRKVLSDNFDANEEEEYNDLLLRGTIVFITGNDLKYDKKFIQIMDGDNDSYRFDQIFILNTTKGKKEFTAKAHMTIYENVEDNNIAAISTTNSSGTGFGGDTVHYMRFFNSKDKEVVRLRFANKSQMEGFFLDYYTRSEKSGYNTTVKNYNKGIKFKN